MKRLTLFLAAAVLITACSNTTNIYVVRHAEKSAPSGDVVLSGDGLMRAETLKDSLKNKKIAEVFTTPFKRTTQTAMPTAIHFGLDTTTYSNGDSLLQKLIAKKKKNYLVVGHSNSVPQMLRAIGLNPGFEGSIPDNQYDNLFIITAQKGKLSLQAKKYGQASH
jgi:phosphohistidine phosphatase SixA